MEDCLDIVMLESGSPGHAIAYARRGGDIAIAKLDCATHLSGLEQFRDSIKLALETNSAWPTTTALESFGRDLHAFCFTNPIIGLWHKLPPSNVRIQLISNHSSLLALPWEFMFDGKSPGPSPYRSIVRIVPTVGMAPGDPIPLVGNKPKVLFVASDPRDQEQVSWNEVKEAISASFARVSMEVNLKVLVSPNWQETLDEIRDFDPDIFHFSGHGQIINGSGNLLFTDKKRNSNSQTVPLRKVCNALQQRNIRLVILTACDTSSGNFQGDFSVIAESLVESGISAVVANQLPVADETAALFVRALYRELIKTGDIDRAVAEGRVALYNTINVKSTDDAALEWGIPTLYRHPGGAQIFKVGLP